jgi:hypothetical protein
MNGASPPAPGRNSPAACRPSRDHSSQSSTTASDRKHPPSSGPTSPRANPASHPGRLVYYTELRKLLIEHGDRLAADIDSKRLPGGLGRSALMTPPLRNGLPWRQKDIDDMAVLQRLAAESDAHP